MEPTIAQDSAPTASAPLRNALVVANPISGRGQARRAAEELARGLDGIGARTELFFTEARGSAFERLRRQEDPLDLVVSVGGDGTLREVFDGLVDPETPVGVLPYGTGNILARDWGLPRDIHRALEIYRRRKLVRLDVSRANGRLSFLVTGVGIDAWAIEEVEANRRGAITKGTYVAAFLRAFARYARPSLQIEVDGHQVETDAGFCLVSHAQRYAGILRLSPGARLDDGLFEVYIFPRGSRFELLRGGLRGLLRHLPGGPVRMHRGRHVRVTSDSPVPFEIDGDLGGTTPLEVEVDSNSYRLVVP